jgi:hypothetical protein
MIDLALIECVFLRFSLRRTPKGAAVHAEILNMLCGGSE